MSTRAILIDSPHPLIHPSVMLLRHESSLLAGNPLGDPTLRHHPLVLSPGFTPRRGNWPLILVLPGYSGTALGTISGAPFKESLPARLIRLMTRGSMPEAIFLIVDGWTRLGGSQFVDSPAVGPYASWIMTELLPATRDILPTNGRLGLIGKSSGGFGALHLAMAYPEQVDGILAVSPDSDFETSFTAEFMHAFRTLRSYQGSVDSTLAGLFSKVRWSGAEFSTMMTLAMSACYADSAENWAIPFDLETGARNHAAWKLWTRFDPVQRLPGEVEGLRKLKYLGLEAGTHDEHGLDLGVRQLYAKLMAAGVKSQCEFFADSHRGLDYRYDVALAPLVESLR